MRDAIFLLMIAALAPGCASPSPVEGGHLLETSRDPDGDGLPDARDRCVGEAEDFDGFEDEDGCPEVDNDLDGIVDAEDLCPNEAERFNGFEDQDGCMDTALCQDCRAIKTLLLVVMFEPGRAEPGAGELDGLEELAAGLLEQPGRPARVEIVGHSSDWGERVDQEDLARQRARYVQQVLLEQGVEPKRLRVSTRGASAPRVPHGGASQRFLNDRVELLATQR